MDIYYIKEIGRILISIGVIFLGAMLILKKEKFIQFYLLKLNNILRTTLLITILITIPLLFVSMFVLITYIDYVGWFSTFISIFQISSLIFTMISIIFSFYKMNEFKEGKQKMKGISIKNR